MAYCAIGRMLYSGNCSSHPTREQIMDKWIFWTYEINGWKWSVWRGAKVIAEGFARSEEEANEAADRAIANGRP